MLLTLSMYFAVVKVQKRNQQSQNTKLLINGVFDLKFKNLLSLTIALNRLSLHFRKRYTRFFLSNARLKLTESQANAKQHPEAELLLFEFCYLKIIHIFHQRYHPKVVGHILKNKQKNKCVCIHEIIWLIMMEMKKKMKNR